MRKFRKILAFNFLALFCAAQFSYITLAQNNPETPQENSTETKEKKEAPKLQAIINAPETIGIDKALIVNASDSINPNKNKELTYKWDFGDGNQKEGKEAVHFYKEPKKYTITLTISNEEAIAETKQEVFATRKSMLLIADDSIHSLESKKRLEGLIKIGEQNGVSIKTVTDFQSSSEFISEEVLAKKLLEALEDLRSVSQIIIWTEGNVGLNALSRVQREITDEEKIDFSSTSIFIIKNNTKQLRQYQRIFETLMPEKIIVGREATTSPFIESTSTQNAINRLTTGGYDFQIVDKNTGQLQIFNFMSYFVNYLINSGIPDNTIVLILLLPVIATVIAFMKQVIGISTFGVYTPTILTLTFWMLGLKFGVITFTILLAIGTIARYLLKKIRILYIPRMAIVLTVVALSIFVILTITVALNLFDAKFISFIIFPLLIMSTLTEKFVSIQSEKGYYAAVLIMAKTILISIIALFFIGGEIDLYFTQFKWDFFRNLMLTYPETILLLIVVNIFLGKWTGLRLLEYVRFREVFRHIEE